MIVYAVLCMVRDSKMQPILRSGPKARARQARRTKTSPHSIPPRLVYVLFFFFSILRLLVCEYSNGRLSSFSAAAYIPRLA